MLSISSSLSLVHFPGGLRNTHLFYNKVRNVRSSSSKVVDFSTNRKRVCDFLFVVSSNLGPILPRFRDITGFLLITATLPTPPLFHLIKITRLHNAESGNIQLIPN